MGTPEKNDAARGPCLAHGWRKQTGSSVPKAIHLNDSASNNIMVTGNLIPQIKPDTGDCVCPLLLTGFGVGL